MTNTLNTPAEAIELQYPLRVEQFESRRGSGGTGRHRGGDGICRVLRALAACEGTLLTDRRTTRPYGLAGGRAAAPGVNQRRSVDVSALPGKARFNLAANDELVIQTPGGGGHGTP